MTIATAGAAKGFLRFPNAWLRLDISPGAKCLLMALCAAADENGVSWFSFAQLSEIVNRSRTSIASYVAELREAGMIATERQRTANGFNHRLRIRVTGWRAMLEGWRRLKGAKLSRPRSERRVRLAERKNPKGSEIQIQRTKTPPPAPPPLSTTTNDTRRYESDECMLDRDLDAEWRRYHANPDDMYFDRSPPADLLGSVIAHAERLSDAAGILTPQSAKAAARDHLTRLAKRRRLESDAETLTALAATLATKLRTDVGIARAVDALDAEWPAHWRRLSTPGQLKAWLETKRITDPGNLAIVWRYRARALRARAELDRRALTTISASPGPLSGPAASASIRGRPAPQPAARRFETAASVRATISAARSEVAASA